ncbi:MAG TPA: methylated-DNA--[protein]-cysteine S-methyltransferase [Holophaga sp.]|nr:methylated-DNA--[protein]-cysteine S-methyltransferase [Holophaga sp.]
MLFVPPQGPADLEFEEAALRRLCGPTGGGPEGEGILAAVLATPLGPMVAAAVPEGVCLLEFSNPMRLPVQVRTLARRLTRRISPGNPPLLEHLQRELEAYFAGQLRTFTVPLFTLGTPFQAAVWGELARIPYGTTLSYEALAERIGKPAAFRAVGRANGMNPVSILLACHRVLNKSGSLCGYGGGLWRKQALLELERTGRLPAGLDTSHGAVQAPL